MFIFEVDFVLNIKDQRSKTIFVCLLFHDLKISTKEGTVKERIHLFFIKSIRKKLLKGK